MFSELKAPRANRQPQPALDMSNKLFKMVDNNVNKYNIQ